jgi:hypothetical protein
MKANFGLFNLPEQRLGKKERYEYYRERSLTLMRRFARERRLKYDRETAEQAGLMVTAA